MSRFQLGVFSLFFFLVQLGYSSEARSDIVVVDYTGSLRDISYVRGPDKIEYSRTRDFNRVQADVLELLGGGGDLPEGTLSQVTWFQVVDEPPLSSQDWSGSHPQWPEMRVLKLRPYDKVFPEVPGIEPYLVTMIHLDGRLAPVFLRTSALMGDPNGVAQNLKELVRSELLLKILRAGPREMLGLLSEIESYSGPHTEAVALQAFEGCWRNSAGRRAMSVDGSDSLSLSRCLSSLGTLLSSAPIALLRVLDSWISNQSSVDVDIDRLAQAALFELGWDSWALRWSLGLLLRQLEHPVDAGPGFGAANPLGVGDSPRIRLLSFLRAYQALFEQYRGVSPLPVNVRENAQAIVAIGNTLASLGAAELPYLASRWRGLRVMFGGADLVSHSDDADSPNDLGVSSEHRYTAIRYSGQESDPGAVLWTQAFPGGIVEEIPVSALGERGMPILFGRVMDGMLSRSSKNPNTSMEIRFLDFGKGSSVALGAESPVNWRSLNRSPHWIEVTALDGRRILMSRLSSLDLLATWEKIPPSLDEWKWIYRQDPLLAGFLVRDWSERSDEVAIDVSSRYQVGSFLSGDVLPHEDLTFLGFHWSGLPEMQFRIFRQKLRDGTLRVSPDFFDTFALVFVRAQPHNPPEVFDFWKELIQVARVAIANERWSQVRLIWKIFSLSRWTVWERRKPYDWKSADELVREGGEVDSALLEIGVELGEALGRLPLPGPSRGYEGLGATVEAYVAEFLEILERVPASAVPCEDLL